MRKTFAKTVPKNQDQKDNGRDRRLDFLEQIENDPSFLGRVITGEESWIFDPETKRQSQEPAHFSLTHFQNALEKNRFTIATDQYVNLGNSDSH